MKNKEINMSKLLYTTAKIILGKYLKKLFNTHYIRTKQFEDLKKPYVLLANHTNFWDPVLVACGVHEYVYFVASDEYFRKLFLKTLLHHAGAIPKTKFFSDSETVKNIFKVKKKGGVIGIFPEGKRNWDGKTLEILYPTAKLIKSLKIPVVVALLKGAALSYPRWAKKPRRGKITIEYKMVLTTEQVTELTIDDIYKIIKTELSHDEYQWQKERMISYKGKALAERLELYLFTCPHCKVIGNMVSRDNHFYCQSCNYSISYNSYGFLEMDSDSDTLYFDNPRDWNQWQLTFLKKIIEEKKPTDIIFSDNGVNLSIGKRLSPLKQFGTGQITLFSNRLQFENQLKKYTFFIDKIHGMNIQYNDQFEFYYEKILYRFSFKNPHIAAYKWMHAVTLLNQ